MTFLEKKLTKAWNSTFDRMYAERSSDIPNDIHIPYPEIRDYPRSKNLGRAIPSVGNVFGHNVPKGNATAYVESIRINGMRDFSIPSDRSKVELDENSTTLWIKFNKISISGEWLIAQPVNRWTTKGWGPFKVPWREDGRQDFEGPFSSSTGGYWGIVLNLKKPNNLDSPPTVSYKKSIIESPKLTLDIDGKDNDSKLVANGIKLFQVFNSTISDSCKSVLANFLSENGSINSFVTDNVNSELKRFWDEEI